MSRWANKYVIGLTGNVAVGKSVVRQMLQHLGAYTIDADGLTHQAMAPGAPAYAPIVEHFGRVVLDEEGRINRTILGGIAFMYPEALARLESIVHPTVLQAINTLISRAKQPVIVVEAIKLLETDLRDAVDTVWVVNAAPETQLKRLMEKRSMSADDAKRRIIAQRPQMDKLSKARRVINNDTSVDETWKQVQAGWDDVRKAVTGSAAPPAPAPQPAAAPPPPRPTIKPVTGTLRQPAPVATVSVNVKRGMPGNAELIANFISQVGGKPTDRMDIMLAFGQKSYLLAQDSSERVVALMGWQVENLITRADEFYIHPEVAAAPVINALVTAIEDASKELQSEVGFILLPDSTSPETMQSFMSNGYEATTMEQIRVPAWREAVHDLVSANPRILTKKLRADRVMKPI